MRLRSGTAYAADVPAALPHDVLMRIFSLLPRGALAVTPGRVSRAWAAGKAQAWAALKESIDGGDAPFLPAWYVREAYANASPDAKHKMRWSTVKHGMIDAVAELCAVDGASFGAADCAVAAEWGQLPTLQLLHERGCPLEASTFNAAAFRGHLPVLCRGQDYTWDHRTMPLAAEGGHVDVLTVLVLT
jgi:hypothetical protein